MITLRHPSRAHPQQLHVSFQEASKLLIYYDIKLLFVQEIKSFVAPAPGSEGI